MKKVITASPLFTHSIDYCNKQRLIEPQDTVIVGFSGGPDSLFLLHILAAWLPAEQLIAAHLDHGWRATSQTEALWCEQKANELGVRCVIGHFATYAHRLNKRGSQEDQGRQARRLFFDEIAQHYGATKIALAHHADDQLETFFIRLMRGAGLQGMASIRPAQGNIIHPLLHVTKAEIINFLNTHAYEYIVDPSNNSPFYLRNRIRQSLIPALSSCDTRAEKNSRAAIAHLQEIDAYFDEEAQKLYATIRTEEAPLGLHLSKLQECHPLIRHRILLLWLCSAKTPFTPTKAFFAEIERFLFNHRTHARHTIAPGWCIVKKQGIAYLTMTK